MASDEDHVSMTDDCISYILEYLKENGEAMVSHLYEKGFGIQRVNRALRTLQENGCLDFYVKPRGQRRNVYYLNEKGKNVYCLNRMIRGYMDGGELDLEEELGEEVVRKLRSRYFREEETG